MVEGIVALLPILFAGWFFFGWPALKVVIICTVAAFATEFIWQRVIGGSAQAFDGSAILTGILLGCVLTAEVPWWMPILGAVVAITVGKQVFGGVGNHPFNSALVGWTFLQVSYKDTMETFPLAEPQFLMDPGEYLSDPPLVALRDDFESILEVPWQDLFWGNVAGTIGTVSMLAALIGGAYLLYRRVITWHIPFSFILSAWIFAFIFYTIDPELYAPPTFHILSGWIMFGAFFLAPEKGTAPVTPKGMIFYGIGCGVLTIIIRTWGVYIEGVPFAILLMNATTPLLDRLRPKPLGRTV
jgi:electron transport complex protein RnfD